MKNTRRIDYYALAGGEDLVTPIYSRKPGTLLGSINFECDSGGRYRRIAGYERYDGHPSPSDASYWVLDFKSGTVEVAAGSTVTGATSGATGVALVAGVLVSGTYAGGDAAGYLVLYNVSDDFVYGENLQVSAVTVCVSDGRSIERGASTAIDLTYYYAAIEARRNSISAVTGSGDILGVWAYNGSVYAFRNNAGGTAAAMWKSSTSGWTSVSLGYYLNFDTGTAAFTVGQTVSGAAASGVLKKIVITSGAWSDSNATGYMVFASITGAFVNNETITSATGSAKADGTQAAITLQPSGHYEFVNYNFGGHSGTYSMYGCDGENYAFEYDGTTFCPIRTGMTTDTPTHITAHKNHLFLSFTGGSVQNSSLGEPTTWAAVTGAAEISIGQEIVGFAHTAGDLLSIIGRNSISILSGSGSADWALSSFAQEIGGIEWSIQKLYEPIFLDNTGVMSLSAVDTYGDFKTAALSGIIEPVFTSLKIGRFCGSIRCRGKEQYRMYFTDKTGINMSFNGTSITGFTQLSYDHVVTCTCSSEDSSGNELLFFGSDNGIVYQLDKGTSFDGSTIRALIRTSINHLKSPENTKRFFKIVVERDDNIESAVWDIAHWNTFAWDTENTERSESYLDETDTGYDYVYYSSSAYLNPFTLQGIILHYSIGGLKR